MTAHVVIVTYSPGEPGLDATLYTNKGLTIDTPLQVVRGDGVYFQYVHEGGSGSAVFSSFDSDVFSSSSDATVDTGGSYPVGIRADAALGVLGVDCDASGLYEKIYLYVVDSLDSTPDSFSITDVSEANPDKEYVSNVIKVTGINTSVTATASGSGKLRRNDGAWLSSLTVYNNDRLSFRLQSGGDYGDSVSTTIAIGGTSDTWTVSNKTEPDALEEIDLGINSGTIKLSDLVSFFGGTYPAKLTDYRRGGGLVPNIAGNVGVPAFVPIKLTDFYGAVTALYFDLVPDNFLATRDTVASGGGTLSKTWSKGADFTFGFGAVSDAVQLRYIQSQDLSNGQTSASMTSASGSPGTFSSSNTWVKISKTAGASVESLASGTIQIQARSPKDTSIVVTYTVQYSLNFFGP